MSIILLLAVLIAFLVLAAAAVAGLVALGRAIGSAWLPIGIVCVVGFMLFVGAAAYFLVEVDTNADRAWQAERDAESLLQRDAQRSVATVGDASDIDADAIDRAIAKETGEKAKRPAWVDADHSALEDGTRQTLDAGPYTPRAACDRELDGRLAEAARARVARLLGDGMGRKLQVLPEWLHRNIVVDEYEEVTKHAFGPGAEEEPMYHRYLLVEFDDVADQYLVEQVRQATVGRRLASAGFLVAGVLLVLTTIFGYLKITPATNGKYAGRLMFVAGGVILGFGAAAASLFV